MPDLIYRLWSHNECVLVHHPIAQPSHRPSDPAHSTPVVASRMISCARPNGNDGVAPGIGAGSSRWPIARSSSTTDGSSVFSKETTPPCVPSCPIKVKRR